MSERRWRYLDGGTWRTTAEESIEPIRCNEFPKADEELVPAAERDRALALLEELLDAIYEAATMTKDEFTKDQLLDLREKAILVREGQRGSIRSAPSREDEQG